MKDLSCRFEHRPELNEVLYLHYKGITKLENLEVCTETCAYTDTGCASLEVMRRTFAGIFGT